MPGGPPTAPGEADHQQLIPPGPRPVLPCAGGRGPLFCALMLNDGQYVVACRGFGSPVRVTSSPDPCPTQTSRLGWHMSVPAGWPAARPRRDPGAPRRGGPSPVSQPSRCSSSAPANPLGNRSPAWRVPELDWRHRTGMHRANHNPHPGGTPNTLPPATAQRSPFLPALSGTRCSRIGHLRSGLGHGPVKTATGLRHSAETVPQ